VRGATAGPTLDIEPPIEELLVGALASTHEGGMATWAPGESGAAPGEPGASFGEEPTTTSSNSVSSRNAEPGRDP